MDRSGKVIFFLFSSMHFSGKKKTKTVPFHAQFDEYGSGRTWEVYVQHAFVQSLTSSLQDQASFGQGRCFATVLTYNGLRLKSVPVGEPVARTPIG